MGPPQNACSKLLIASQRSTSPPASYEDDLCEAIRHLHASFIQSVAEQPHADGISTSRVSRCNGQRQMSWDDDVKW